MKNRFGRSSLARRSRCLLYIKATVFCISFFRLARAIIDQRRIEKEGSDQAHFINGIGWISLALKLGAVESVVGFAGGSFGADLTRRIMRMVARGCLCIGIVKGYVSSPACRSTCFHRIPLSVDTTEDFHVVQRELNLSKVNSRNAKAGLRNMISNPRFSSFRQLSPTAAAFHAARSTNAASSATSREKTESSTGRHYSTWSQRQSRILQGGLPGMQAFATVKQARSKQRVTVQYKDGTPRLHMRFSSSDLPRVHRQESRQRRETPAERAAGPLLPRADRRPNSRTPQNTRTPRTSRSCRRPRARWAKDAGSIMSYRDSMKSSPSLGPYEIVDARKLGQRVAVAQMYQPPSATARDAASPLDAVAFPEAVYQPPAAKAARPGRTASKNR